MDIVSFGGQWLASLFEIWFCFRLVLYFMILEDRVKLWEHILRWAGIVVFGSLLALNRTIAFFSHGMFVIEILFSVLCMMCIVRKKVVLVSCIVTTFYAMIALQDFAFAFICIIFDRYSFEKIYWFENSIWKSMIYFCSRVFLAILISVLLRRKHVSENALEELLEEYWKPFLALDLFLLFVLRIYHTFMILLLKDKTQYMENMAKEILASLVVLLALTYITVLLFLKNSYTANQNKFLSFQEKLLKEKYQEIAEEMGNQQKVVHDMKHHFLALRGLLTEHNMQKMETYLSDVEKEFVNLKMKKWTEDEIVNLILNQKKSLAQKAGIDFQVDTQGRIEIPVSDSENCAVFGNLLDNAIEACEGVAAGERWISIKMKRQGRMFMLEIENSAEYFPRKLNGQWLSSKQDKLTVKTVQ